LTIIKSDPKNVGAHVQLANTYFDAERYPGCDQVVRGGAQARSEKPRCEHRSGRQLLLLGRTDEALKQFENSLKLNPKHAKTLFNKGIVLAFGKRDLQGATEAWQQVVQLAPGTPKRRPPSRGCRGSLPSQGRATRAQPAPPRRASAQS
jgi:tetratricopeptide (TPR) repeat protein